MLNKSNLKNILSTISLIGESGTGKSQLAKSIHSSSPLMAHPYIPVNVASISKELFESEIYGHRKGSFTGAINDKKGLLEEVGKGTLFLDEAQELSLEQQAKLLTILEEKYFKEVGSNFNKAFNGRIIFSFNESLESLVEKKLMRFDFYQRIRSFCYRLNPLRENPNLKQEILSVFDSKKIEHQNFSVYLSAKCLSVLKSYDYPGNYRELIGILDYIALLGRGEIEEHQLPITNIKSSNIDSNLYSDALVKFEREFLLKKLNKYNYAINLTAQETKISKVTLISKIKKYDINIKQLKEDKIRAS